jgi:uncharacterized lipoprotein YmbA
MRKFGIMCLAFALSGCISVPNSPEPRFYVLEAAHEDQAIKKINIASDALIGIGPVKIPENQNRPQIVTRGKEKMIKFAQFDRWGESLDLGITRLIGEYLKIMLPDTKFTLYPWSSPIPVKYQVIVEIVQLDSELNKDLIFVAQWLIIDAQSTKTMLIKKSEFRHEIIPHNYTGLAKTLSAACESLSGEIAEALAALESLPKTKEGSPRRHIIPGYN